MCFTGFNETGYEFNENQMKYLVVGKEICPTTGKEHWQGYVELKNAKTFSAIKKLFKDNKLHLEERKGNALQASNYCKKDGKYIEFGELSSQGVRSDLVALKDDILAGKKLHKSQGRESRTIPPIWTYVRQNGRRLFMQTKTKLDDQRNLDLGTYWMW